MHKTREMERIPLYFSFSLYGKADKYWRGMLENIRLIRAEFPSSTIMIHYTDDVPAPFFKEALKATGLVLWRIPTSEPNKMIQRLLRLDNIEKGIIFVRDADSRVTSRDIHCMRTFIFSDKQYHAIRDHPYHRSRIMGGIFGLKKVVCAIKEKYTTPPSFKSLFSNWLKQVDRNIAQYGLDEAFLRSVIFPIIEPRLLIQSDCVGHAGEHVEPIGCSLIDDTEFIGNVYDYVGGEFRPVFRYREHINVHNLSWLKEQKQWRILYDLVHMRDIRSYRWDERASILHLYADACIELGLAWETSCCLSKFRWALMDDRAIEKGNNLIELLRKQKWRIVASFDAERVANPHELVIIYGDYCHDIRYLPVLEKDECGELKGCVLYRHPLYFAGVTHDAVEYCPIWEPVEQIYILNLRERRDRYMHLLVELCKVQAPLHRIYHYQAEKKSITGNAQRDSYLGATKNHLDVVEDFKAKEYTHCLILEDDFLFNSNVHRIQTQIATFFERKYIYDICFLGYSKYGEIRDYDDLLSHSYQACTTSSAYFLSKDTVNKVHECLCVGYESILAGGDPGIYCCDRYWAKLQSGGHFFVFRDKLGFQRIMHSDIVNRINYNFD